MFESMEIVNRLSKQDRECRFCSAGHCSREPVTVKTIIKGKPAKLNTCLPASVPVELKGEAAKVYTEDEMQELRA